jgi:hypothetical protein
VGQILEITSFDTTNMLYVPYIDLEGARGWFERERATAHAARRSEGRGQDATHQVSRAPGHLTRTSYTDVPLREAALTTDLR